MKFKYIFHLIFGLSLTLLLSACWNSGSNIAAIDTTNIYELENIQVSPRLISSTGSRAQNSSLRFRILQDSAMGLGAQAGLAWASEKMNARMIQDHKYLDTIYNFDGMMLSHGVIPPVLEEGRFTLNLADPNTIRVADRTYKIVKQARFATTPPHWREYLLLHYAQPELPDCSLLPRTDVEQKIWRKAVRAGWEKGIQQSYTIFQQNLALLKRDFRGMILYRNLLQQKMISPPFVARTELGVTGDGSNMNINDQVLRIVELPQLQTSSRNWRAVVVKND